VYFLVVVVEENEVKFVLFDHIVVMVVAKAKKAHLKNSPNLIRKKDQWSFKEKRQELV
jgi:hypothetical protein